jgi:hypothetical protein
MTLALSGASCGSTCPAGQQSCGSSNAGAGTSGASANEAGGTGYDGDTCSMLTALKKCMTAYCASASNPFCTCYRRNYDLTTNGCVCIDFDAKAYCDRYPGDGRSYDCAAHSSAISSYCVPVR